MYSYQIIIVFKKLYLTIKRTLSGTIIPSQSGPGSNGNKSLLHTGRSVKTGALPLYAVYDWLID